MVEPAVFEGTSPRHGGELCLYSRGDWLRQRGNCESGLYHAVEGLAGEDEHVIG